MTAEECLTIERAAEERREFFDGKMLPRSGASLGNVSLQTNIIGAFHPLLRCGSCEIFPSTLRVCVLPGPDVRLPRPACCVRPSRPGRRSSGYSCQSSRTVRGAFTRDRDL